MREENQIRERLERLIRESEILRQQCARSLLSEHIEDWQRARDTMSRLATNEASTRTLEWALGGKT